MTPRHRIVKKMPKCCNSVGNQYNIGFTCYYNLDTARYYNFNTTFYYNFDTARYYKLNT